MAETRFGNPIFVPDATDPGHAATLDQVDDAATSAVADHVAASDPHSQYLTATEGNAAYQPVDTDLSNIAALTPSNNDVIQRKSGAWTNRTITQLLVDLAAVGTTFQPLDEELTEIAGLSPSTNDFLQYISGAWANRSIAQVRTALNQVKPFPPVNLTDGSTPALDASLGTHFRLTAAGNRTIAVPSSPTDGQVIVIEHLASGGARTLALNTGTGGFKFGTDITALTATTSGAIDYIQAVYRQSTDKWNVIGYVKGY
jgi:hypothetical protein